VTLYILDINENKKNIKKHFIKTISSFVVISIFCFVLDKIYAIFGHGVKSDYMRYMFLYPIIGGAVLYMLIALFIPKLKCIKGYRIFYNCYNSGIAILTVGSLYIGILEIAGTNSSFSSLFEISGIIVVSSSLLFIVIVLITHFAKLRQHLS